MSRDSEELPQEELLLLGEAQLDLKRRAESAGLTAEAVDGWGDGEAWLRVEYPEGRGVRSVEYDEENAEALANVDLTSVRFLPESAGLIFTDSGVVESRIRVRQQYLLRRVPGFETLTPEASDNADEDLEVAGLSAANRFPAAWRIGVEKGKRRLELSPGSDVFRAVMGYSGRLDSLHTLKVLGPPLESSAETLEEIQKLADAFFFDMDVRYGVSIELFAAPHRPFRSATSRMKTPPIFPINKYQPQPVALYRYGRSAVNLPLLSFLAYYQVLEFFFPIFTQEEITRRAKQTLLSPRFDPNDEVSLLRLVNTIQPNVRAGIPEKEQLRSTLRRCVSTETLESFLASTETVQKYFFERPQAVPSLTPLRRGGGADIRDQVADRIYDIRCRIVHTKSDGGDGGVDLLLPTGKEARSLGADIELVRLAAQEAIIAGAAPLD